MRPSEVYAWLQDNPVGAYVVVLAAVADEIMLTQGGMLYKDDRWCRLWCETLSPGTLAICLRAGLENETREGEGPFVSLRYHEPE